MACVRHRAVDSAICGGRSPYGFAVDLPGLNFVDAEVRAAVEAFERQSDNLDTKAGLCIGFAGVLAGILLRAAAGATAYVALGVDFAVAVLSLLAYRTPSHPVLNPSRLRRYIEYDQASCSSSCSTPASS